MKKYIFFVVFCLLNFVACKDYLDKGYEGGVLYEDELEPEQLVDGIYSLLYAAGGSDHDNFGQRSIDLATDILSGDIAITRQGYGWFEYDEQMLTSKQKNGEIWSYYFSIVRASNLAIKFMETKYGIKATYLANGDPNASGTHAYTEEEAQAAIYWAKALTMRGFALSKLATFFTPVIGSSYYTEVQGGIQAFKCCPVYDETNFEDPQPLSTSERVFYKSIEDLELAIQVFEQFSSYYASKFGKTIDRFSKLDVDIDVASGILAFTYLTMAPYYETIDATKMAELNENALKYAQSVMTRGQYQLLSRDKLYSTGFNNVESECWMWGQNVIMETTTSLASWFGHVDPFTYAYGYVAPKAIDADLYAKFQQDSLSWDARKGWFELTSDFPSGMRTHFLGCPTNKFYSAINRDLSSTRVLDREWMSDNIFMRYESMYLIAAEAAWKLERTAEAKSFLTTITDQRVLDTTAACLENYEKYKKALDNSTLLGNAIADNWRIEMWGEGYGLATLRRLTKSMTRGSNHFDSPGRPIDVTSEYYEEYFYFEIPTSESTYNPYFSRPAIAYEGNKQ